MEVFLMSLMIQRPAKEASCTPVNKWTRLCNKVSYLKWAENCRKQGPYQFDASQIGNVGLVLFGHEEEQNAVKELDAIEGGHAHVEEHPVQHWHGDEFEDKTQFDGDTDGEENQDVRQPLFSNA